MACYHGNVSMKEYWTFIKEHPVYSNVTAGLILAGILAILNQVFSWNFFSLLSEFLAQEWIVSMWGLITIGVGPLVTLSIALLAIALFQKDTPEPDWKYYMEDNIFGVVCNWKYLGNGIDPDSVITICPVCKRLIQPSPNNYRHGFYHYFECLHCDFKTGDLSVERNDIRTQVMLEIDGRIRSGEYKNKIKKKL